MISYDDCIGRSSNPDELIQMVGRSVLGRQAGPEGLPLRLYLVDLNYYEVKNGNDRIYLGRQNTAGSCSKGEIAANTKEDVLALLRKQNIQPINVVAKPKEIRLSFGAPKVKDKDIVIFTRQLATMIDAGLPLVQCLDILGSQTENKTLRRP